MRLQRLAQIITRSNCVVKIASDGAAHTDGKTISIDPRLAGNDSPAKIWVRLLALLHHEVYHCLWSDFRAREKMIKSLPPGLQSLGAIVSNILEDGRIELLGTLDRPGTRKWIGFVNEENWQRQEASGDIKKDLLASLISRATLGKDIKGLKPEHAEILDGVQELLDRGVTSGSCRECMECAAEITRVISKHLIDPKDIDFGKPDFPKTEGKDAPGELAEQARELRAKKPEKKGSGDKKQAESTVERTKKSSDEKKDGSAEDKRADGDDDSDGSSPGDSEGDADESSGISGDPSDDDGDGFGDSDDSSAGDEGSTGFGEPPRAEKGPGSDKDKPDSAACSPDTLTEEEMTELLAGAEKEISGLLALEKDKNKYEEIPLGDVNLGIRLVETPGKSMPSKYQSEIQAKIMPLARRLARLLKPLFTPRREDTMSGLRRGSLDPSEVWRLPKLGDDAVFERRNQPSHRLDVAVFFLIDQSGSMSHVGKYLHAQKATAILAEAFSLLRVPFAAVSFSALLYGPQVSHRRIVDWGSSDFSRIPSIFPDGDNRDGYSIRVAANELLRRREKVRILFVLSDGYPAHAYDSYKHSRGVNDTRPAVKEATKRGLIVQGVLVSKDGSDQEAAMFIYPNLLIVEDFDRLPDQIAYKMRQLLSRFK
ncbi:MAG: hypothetical protein NUV48_07200 [Peptococcaceae bacterium]|nr:hypothetical protein [Peptococcaceae bacterium]